MKNRSLVCKVADIAEVSEKKVVEFKYVAKSDTSILKIRDVLMRLGTVLEENLEQQIYVAEIPAGFANKNAAVIAIQLSESTILFAGYAREGIIHQHTVEKAFERILCSLYPPV